MKTSFFVHMVYLFLGVNCGAFAIPSSPGSAEVFRVVEPTTLYENADLQSGRFEVQPQQQLLVTDGAKNGFSKAGLLSADGARVELVGYVRGNGWHGRDLGQKGYIKRTRYGRDLGLKGYVEGTRYSHDLGIKGYIQHNGYGYFDGAPPRLQMEPLPRCGQGCDPWRLPK
jgi:hypothetical protein